MSLYLWARRTALQRLVGQRLCFDVFCATRGQVRLHVSLPPAYVGNIEQGVREVLNDYLMKYERSRAVRATVLRLRV